MDTQSDDSNVPDTSDSPSSIQAVTHTDIDSVAPAGGMSASLPVAVSESASISAGLPAAGLPHGNARVSRRTLLVVGGGLLVVGGGTAVLVKELHLLGHMRSKVLQHLGVGQSVAPHAHTLPDGPMATPHDVVIFDGALASSWQDWSWGTHRISDTSLSYAQKPTLSLQLVNWGGLQLRSATFDTTGLGYVQCWVRSVAGTTPVVRLALLAEGGAWIKSVLLGDYTQGGSISQDVWRLARVPLTDLGVDARPSSGVVLQAGASQLQGTLYLADLRIVYHPDLRPPHPLRAWSFDLATITLAFDQPMEGASAARAAAYRVVTAASSASTSDPAYPVAHPVTPLVARYHSDARTVSLTMPTALHAGASYTVALDAITDRVGVRTAPGTQARVQVAADPLSITVDVAAQRRAINPAIYGMAGANAATAADLGVTVQRWGGNATTRYNWKLGNAFNAARDYHFQNGNYGATSPADRQPSGVADKAIADNRAHKLQTLLTIPTIGWVARNDSSSSASQNVPARGGPPRTSGGDAIDNYDPTANRQRTSVPSRARKGAPFSDPPDLHDETVAQDEWVYHLTQRFGRAAEGGVRYYAMDNEPDLWWMTHTDVRPAQMSYDQMRDTFLSYAAAIKDVDPTAQITGPVSWGWPNYFHSALDYGTDNYRTHDDSNAHNGMPFLAWWLGQIRRHDEQAGRRTLDVFDLHFYPQGGEYGGDASPDMAARRLRSTRALWDPSYSDESWIGAPVRLIPRMREWVAANYPGTQLALTEWNWGAEGTVNGALALADVLGIFGREGLDLACHWGGLSAKTPGYVAFKLFGNYDSAGSSFVGTSVATQVNHADLLRCYAADTNNGALLLMVLNTSTDSDLTPTLRVLNAGASVGGSAFRQARVWHYWPDDMPHGSAATITPGAPLTLAQGSDGAPTCTYTFPASSITLLRLEAGQ